MISAGLSTLKAGARIVFHDRVSDVKARLLLSSGTRRVSDMPELAGKYSIGAFVPRRPWRNPSADELAVLTLNPAQCGHGWRVGSDVAIIQIPPDLIHPLELMLEEHGVREQCVTGAYTSISNHPKWAENLAALNRYVGRLSSGSWMDVIYFRITDAAQLTVTKDEFGIDGRRFAGMHLDSWDRLPLRHRYRSRNRLCINLSREPRYSLFLNLPLMSMFEHLGLRDPDDIYEDFRGLTLGQRFMRTCPEYPVVRLQIEPGEAYLLPTDNLIHDASTEGNTFPDITLTYLGLFSSNGF